MLTTVQFGFECFHVEVHVARCNILVVGGALCGDELLGQGCLASVEQFYMGPCPVVHCLLVQLGLSIQHWP